MTPGSIAVHNTGLVTSLGWTTAATCAALRAGIANPTLTRFMGADGEWVMGHQVAVEERPTDLRKLSRMAALAIEECVSASPPVGLDGIPLLLCTAERERPGRLDGLDDRLFGLIQADLDAQFHPRLSATVPAGRPGALLALERAMRLIEEEGVQRVLIVGVDSLLVWPTIVTYGDQSRLLAEENSNGFMPGEAAGAVLVAAADGRAGELLCLGTGQGVEAAPLGSGEPLRADGLTAAIGQALAAAGVEMHDLDFRITDLSGEHYYFKEAALALARTLRQPKAEFDLWHPAEGIGEAGAAAGPVMIATALTASQKGYGPGPRILLHASGDVGMRAAAVMAWTEQ